MKQYPFKFLDPYSKEDARFFSGRDEEIAQLYEMVFQSSILLVYGASGTGKTSLIQCGLASRFASHDWMALTVRRGTDMNASLEKVLADADKQGGAATSEPDWLSKFKNRRATPDERPVNGVTTALKNIYLNTFKPIYLIFDQFEELYIFGSKEEQNAFIGLVQQILLVEQPVKMIFSIREEFLGYLDEFERAVPELTRKKLRVEPMNDTKIRQVITRMTANATSLVTIAEGEEEQVEASIFEKLKITERAKTIQLPYLQVFLDRFYLAVTKDETRTAEAVFTMEALSKQGRIGDVLQHFLEEQVMGISGSMLAEDGRLTPETIWNMLSPFATLEGTKEPISKTVLYERLPEIGAVTIDRVVEAFISGRIIRYDEGADRYELAHDSLAVRIAEKRSKQETDLLEARSILKFRTARYHSKGDLLSDSDLSFVELFLPKLKLTPEEQQLVDKSRAAAEERQRSEQLRLEKENRQLKKTQALYRKNAKWQKVIIAVIGAFLLLAIAFAYHSITSYDRLQALQAKTRTLVASVYFYRDKIGLSKMEKDGKLRFGFIDRNLNMVIDYKYTEAETFDDTGFAKAKRNGHTYLVDMEGKEYLMSSSLDSLTDATTALYLSRENFKTFPKQVFAHTNLKVLILSDCNLKDLPAGIGKLVNLKHLDLAQNYFRTIPASVLQLRNLRGLNLSGNELSSVPEGITQLEKLEDLQLYWNPKLLSLPVGLGSLKSLQWLDVSDTGVKKTDAGVTVLLKAAPKCKVIWKGNQAY